MIAEVYGNVVYAMGFAASTDVLAQAHPKMFDDVELKCCNRVLWARGAALVQTTVGNGFECFDDPDGCNGICPSANNLFTLWCEWMEKRAPAVKLDQLVQEVEGEVCSCDFNVEGCDDICGGRRVRPLPSEALFSLLAFS